ncbi:MAG: TDT family transporter [Brevinema sp.]
MFEFNRIKNFPIGAVATAVGMGTLGNVLGGFGLVGVRHMLILIGAFMWVLGLCKVILFFPKYKEEYQNPVMAGLYAACSMFLMIFGNYIAVFSPSLGRILLVGGIFLHLFFIALFTYVHVIKKFQKDFFMPTWFVTYFGVLVGAVLGKELAPPALLQGLVYYSAVAFILVFIPLVKKAFSPGIGDKAVHTKAIYLAPSSLCLVSYINNFSNNNLAIIITLYVCILAGWIYILCNMKRFFIVDFQPGFAGLTFPTAISCVAGLRMAAFIKELYPSFSAIVSGIAQVQIFFTAAFILFILLNFFRLFITVKEA